MRSVILLLFVFCCFVAVRHFTRRWQRKRRIEQIGQQGEANVAHTLGQLPKKSYIVFNDLMLKKGDGRLAQIDHVVLSPYGIFVIETKFRHGQLRGHIDAEVWHQSIGSKQHTFENPLRQNAVHVRTIREYLPAVEPSSIHSVVVVPHDTELSISGASTVIHEHELLRYMRKFQLECIDSKQLKMATKVLRSNQMAGLGVRRAHVRDTKRHHGG